MKRFALMLLSIALILSCLCLAGAEEDKWAVGNKLDGFTVTDVRRFDLYGADIVTLVHDKTAATVMLVMNEDTNRAFEITFRTTQDNSEGTPHVFEHATLGGSEKYPSRELFFNLSYQTYNTYMNAATYPYMTTYPVASLSEEQLLRYADFYLDSCFNPNIMQDESLFKEEAWRYAMSSADDELTITGTVYNEMKGAYTISNAAYYNFLETIYPGSNEGYVSGGKPSDIPGLTWDEVKEYHETYYHPSNSVTVVYGKLDKAEEFLSLMDSVFSAYEFRDYSNAFEQLSYAPLTESVSAVYPFAAEQGSDTDGGAYILYGFVCDGATKEEQDALSLLSVLMDDGSSVLMQNMRDYMPHADLSCYTDFERPDPVVFFWVNGVNGDEAETVKQIIDMSLAQVAEEGFDPEAADAIASSYAIDIMLSQESESVGTDLIPDLVYYWANGGSLYGYMDYIDTIDNLTAWAADGTYQALTAKYLNADAITALVVTEPVPGMKEAEDEALKAYLAEVKASMTDEEIAAIVEYTNSTIPAVEGTADMVAALTAVTVDSLPEEIRVYDITDTVGEDGVRRAFAEAAVDGVGITFTRLNMTGLTQEQLQWAKLYIDLIGELDTSAHSVSELATLINRYLYDVSVRVVIPSDETEFGYTPYLHLGFTALDENLAEGYNVLSELLFDSNTGDIDTIKGIVTGLRTSLKSTITSSAYNIELYRMFANTDEGYALYSYVNYLPYYDFICAVEQMLETEPETVTANLEAVKAYFANAGYGAVTGYSGSADGFAAHTAAADAFVAQLGNEPFERNAYSFEQTEVSEALIVDTNTSYNIVFASWDELGGGEYSADMDAVSALIDDRYLMPQLRDERGAYGAYSGATEYGVYLFTYRDPNVMDTFMTFANLGNMMRNDTGITQELVDGYILSSYSVYALSAGELSGADSALRGYLSGDEADVNAEYMRQLKSLKAEDIASYANIYGNVFALGRMATVSSASIVNANETLFMDIMNPFGVKDMSKVELTDITEDDPRYTAVRWCFDNAYMFADENGAFRPDETVTLGELVIPMYKWVGGDDNVDDAIEFLAGYEIIDALPAETELCRDDLIVYMGNYFWALGGDYDGNVLGDYADASDISEGYDVDWAWFIDNELIFPSEDGLLLPLEPATRADAANIVFGFFGE